ncbi:GatB/YqeY domain-containing protein [Candidatus Uhrbacteria bacterium]|nr:GatB/YqeY domain-containing protein [Candidatus Uhrbacteria bacterium]
MSLSDQITNAMKDAMKSKNNATLSTLRLLRSAMKNKQIDVQHELSDEEILGVIRSQVKQLRDGLDSYESAKREDLASQARIEIAVLEAYLPKQISDDELTSIVKKVVEESGVTSKQDMGKAMGMAMKVVQGRADGTRVKQIVESLLAVFVLMIVGVGIAFPAFAAIEIVPVSLQAYSFLETGVRIFRVLLLLFGILAVNMILHGGFSYMISSMRDESHVKAWQKIMTGFIGSIAVVLLYGVSTVVIKVM